MPDYETKLSGDDEKRFQVWKQQYAPKDSGFDYDLRGAFKAGLTPDPKTGHWPDTFKKPNHPTFSVESIYAKQRPELAGRWEGEKFIKPSPTPTPTATPIPASRMAMPDYGTLTGGAAGRVRRFDDRRDLLDAADNAFYGGGQVQPTPTPTPTPNPVPRSGTMKVSDSPLYNIPPPFTNVSAANRYPFFDYPKTSASALANAPGRLDYNAPQAQSSVMRTYSQLPVGPLELGMPAPRFNLLRDPFKSGNINPVFRFQEAAPPPGTVPDSTNSFMQNEPPTPHEMDMMKAKYGFNYG